MEKTPGKSGPQVAFEMKEGESENELLKRAGKVIDKLRELDEDNILVVAHNSFISVIFYVLENIQDISWMEYRNKWDMKNAEIRVKEL